MRLSFFSITLVCMLLIQAHSAAAEVRLFTGTLEVITTSGKSCGGRKGRLPVTLVVGIDDSQSSGDTILGYIGGDAVTVAKVFGKEFVKLQLRYPYPDAERAEGNLLELQLAGAALTGNLHDRHLEPTVDDCNVDFGRLEMVETADNSAALGVYQRLSVQYAAQLSRATAVALARQGSHQEATLEFEKALALADTLFPPGSERLNLYLSGLANSYVRSGRYADFNTFYAKRVETLKDNAVRLIFTHHQIMSLLKVGREAMAREDYQTALYNFRQALKLDYKNKDVISATMSALVRSGKHDEAITFLEETEQKLDSEPDRRDVREAIALVSYQKGKKEYKIGRILDAERYLRQAIKLDSGTAQYVITYARWLHKAGKYGEADGMLKRAAEAVTDAGQRQELSEARERLRQTEWMMSRLRKAGK